MRLLKKEKIPKIKPITSDEIRAIRKKEQISQAVFANYLNLTVGYISKLERGLKKPTGPLLTLLNIVQRKVQGKLDFFQEILTVKSNLFQWREIGNSVEFPLFLSLALDSMNPYISKALARFSLDIRLDLVQYYGYR